MLGALTTCVLVCAAPVPPVPANQAPPPRLVKPDISLVMVAWAPGGEGPTRSQLHLIGFRNGKMLPTEVVWTTDTETLGSPFEQYNIVANRLLVTRRGTVFDMRERKVLSSERGAEVQQIGEKKVTYRVQSSTRPGGLFTFEYATGTVTRVGDLPAAPWFDKVPSSYRLSPDGKRAVLWSDGDELVLHTANEKPKSLGKGFKMEEDPESVKFRSFVFMRFPVVWIDNGRFLTQRDHGKLVVVDLAGKVTEFATIKDAPKLASPSFVFDLDGGIFYYLGDTYYQIDVTKRTAVPCEWQSLGHGFEASWKADEKLGHKFRYGGKDIGRFHCFPLGTKTAPGYLALATEDGDGASHAPRRVAVWSVATGEWAIEQFDCLDLTPFVGWVK